MKTTMLMVMILAVIECAACAAELPRRDMALQIWRAPDSSLRQRLDSITVLVPKGTEFSQVEKILGTQGRWGHRHGPSIFVEKKGEKVVSSPAPDMDEWTFDYTVPGGVIKLRFTGTPGKASSQSQFVGATFAESLAPVAPTKQ